MKKIKIKSICKINLSLRVLKKLNTGYHSIKSLITFCDLHDVISINKIQGTKDHISFSGRFKKGINKKSNTIVQVLHQLRKRNFFKNQMFKINIKKNIPQGSGLGGGSGNLICSVWGISNVSISSWNVVSIFLDSPKNLGKA